MAGPIRVAVAGAAGRMGATVSGAVAGAEDLELTGRADPALGTELGDVLDDADVVVDFTVPDQALPNAHACLHAGVPVPRQSCEQPQQEDFPGHSLPVSDFTGRRNSAATCFFADGRTSVGSSDARVVVGT